MNRRHTERPFKGHRKANRWADQRYYIAVSLLSLFPTRGKYMDRTDRGGLVYELSNKTWREVFRPRGISKELAEARPYFRYAQGDGFDVAAFEDAIGMPEEQRWVKLNKRGRRNYIGLRMRTTQAPGLYMTRHPAPVEGGWPWEQHTRPIVAELRPDEAIILNTDKHSHDDGIIVPKGGPKPETRERWRQEALAEEARRKEANKVLANPEAYSPDDVMAAEYLLDDPGKRKVDRRTPEQREKAARAEAKKHIDATHNGIPGPWGVHLANPDGAKYVHEGGYGTSSRLDMHPWAAERLLTLRDFSEWYLIFALEGVLKADAALQHIRDNDLPATVVDVPAVQSWKRDKRAVAEIEAFTRQYLQGIHVKVVCDSDWDPYSERRKETSNPYSVMDPTMELATLLSDWGANAVAVAPRPEPRYCRLHKEKKGHKRGMDDSIADGDGFDTFVPVEKRRRTVAVKAESKVGSTSLSEWKTDIALKELLQELRNGTDELDTSERDLGRMLDRDHKTVHRSLKRVKKDGYIDRIALHRPSTTDDGARHAKARGIRIYFK